MDQSERLYQELLDLLARQKQIELEENAMVKAMAGQVLEAVAMERLLDPNDLRLVGLHAIIDATRKELAGRWKLYRSSVNEAESRLRALTGPVIQKYAEEIGKIQADLKIDREILRQDYQGFEKKWILTIRTNERVVRQLRDLCKKTIVHLETLHLRPISEIENEYRHLRIDLDQIDPLHFQEVIMDEQDYYRGGPPPLGVGSNYTGPLTSMPMGPAKPLSVGEPPIAPGGWITGKGK
jgi:hypothetical protein